jgi:hypothetical protein
MDSPRNSALPGAASRRSGQWENQGDEMRSGSVTAHSAALGRASQVDAVVLHSVEALWRG